MENPAQFDKKVYAATSASAISMRELLEYFTQHGGSMRVSDLHLKAGSPPVYRVDGRLVFLKGAPLDAPTIRELAAALFTKAELAALDEHRSVDGSFAAGDLSFRLNAFFDSDGPVIAMRALDAAPIAVEQIGFPNHVWQDILAAQHGLVLLTGITGAGKSTTVAALIGRIAESRACRIITLEDPIEYRLSSKRALVSQREVGRNVQSFERASWSSSIPPCRPKHATWPGSGWSPWSRRSRDWRRAVSSARRKRRSGPTIPASSRAPCGTGRASRRRLRSHVRDRCGSRSTSSTRRSGSSTGRTSPGR